MKPPRKTPQRAPTPLRLAPADIALLRAVAAAERTKPHRSAVAALRAGLAQRAAELGIPTKTQAAA